VARGPNSFHLSYIKRPPDGGGDSGESGIIPPALASNANQASTVRRSSIALAQVLRPDRVTARRCGYALCAADDSAGLYGTPQPPMPQ
jgi:hypothetical protein